MMELLEKDLGISLDGFSLPIKDISTIDIVNGYVRDEINPITGIERWHNSESKIIKDSTYSLIKFNDFIGLDSNISESILYGTRRSEITNLIRNDVLSNSLFGFHAAFLEYKSRKIIILGDKGTGKTSASLYLYMKGAKIYTDELIIFKDSTSVFTLGRKPSLDECTLKKYFPMFSHRILISSKSILNTNEKKIIDIDILPSQLYTNIDDIQFIVLTKGTIRLPREVLIKKIASQFISNNSLYIKDIAFLYEMLKEIVPMTIEQIKEL